MQFSLDSRPEVSREVARRLLTHEPPYIHPLRGSRRDRFQLNIFELMQDSETFSWVLGLIQDQVENLHRQLETAGRRVDALAALYPYQLGSSLATRLEIPLLLSGKNRGRPVLDSSDQRTDIKSLKTAVMIGNTRSNGDEEVYAARKLADIGILAAGSLTILDNELFGVHPKIVNAGVKTLGRLTTHQTLMMVRTGLF